MPTNKKYTNKKSRLSFGSKLYLDYVLLVFACVLEHSHAWRVSVCAWIPRPWPWEVDGKLASRYLALLALAPLALAPLTLGYSRPSRELHTHYYEHLSRKFLTVIEGTLPPPLESSLELPGAPGNCGAGASRVPTNKNIRDPHQKISILICWDPV